VFVRTLDHGLHAAEIRIPAAATNIMSVAYRIAKARLLTTKFTCECHVRLLQMEIRLDSVTFDATRESAKREAICSAFLGNSLATERIADA
jgi:hypothetical protein